VILIDYMHHLLNRWTETLTLKGLVFLIMSVTLTITVVALLIKDIL